MINYIVMFSGSCYICIQSFSWRHLAKWIMRLWSLTKIVINVKIRCVESWLRAKKFLVSFIELIILMYNQVDIIFHHWSCHVGGNVKCLNCTYEITVRRNMWWVQSALKLHIQCELVLAKGSLFGSRDGWGSVFGLNFITKLCVFCLKIMVFSLYICCFFINFLCFVFFLFLNPWYLFSSR